VAEQKGFDEMTPEERSANYAGAIYGTIIAMSVIATASKDPSLGTLEIAGWAAITGVVFWLVHVYADIVAAGFATTREAVDHLTGALRSEFPIVVGALIPALAMAVFPIFTINDENASYWAVGGGIVMLFATGFFIGKRNHRSIGRRILIGLVNALFGAMILALKIFVH